MPVGVVLEVFAGLVATRELDSDGDERGGGVPDTVAAFGEGFLRALEELELGCVVGVVEEMDDAGEAALFFHGFVGFDIALAWGGGGVWRRGSALADEDAEELEDALGVGGGGDGRGVAEDGGCDGCCDGAAGWVGLGVQEGEVGGEGEDCEEGGVGLDGCKEEGEDV